MLKIVFYVAALVASAGSRFIGGKCIVGTCTALSSCPEVEEEIRAAGNPMPPDMVYKMQEMTCGHNSREPLVCCESSGDSIYSGDDKSSSSSGDLDDRPVWPAGDNGSEEDNTVSKRNNEGPPDVTGHRNLNKLPKICGNMTDSDRIANGDKTALYEMPWMVLLYYNTTPGTTNLLCSGTLISKWYVLTAAHCVAFLEKGRKLDHAILGEWDVNTDPDCEAPDLTSSGENKDPCAPKKRDVGIDAVIAHPGFTPQKLVHDIALIRLAEPADFTSTISPICLPVTSALQRESLVGISGGVAGWGFTENGLQSSVLLTTELKLISNEDCQKAYGGKPAVYETQLCAGGNSNKSTCLGDSGGPMFYPGVVRDKVMKQVQRGIVSYGLRRCGAGRLPGVFTNIAYYMDWILSNIS